MRELYEAEKVPGADDLIAGIRFLAESQITIETAGEYKRGDILMKSGDSFVKSALSGLASASEVCILAENLTVLDGEAVTVRGYFAGHFNMRRVRVEDAGLREYSAKEQVQIIEYMRMHKIFLT